MPTLIHIAEYHMRLNTTKDKSGLAGLHWLWRGNVVPTSSGGCMAWMDRWFIKKELHLSQ
jgi:hypothetical protein